MAKPPVAPASIANLAFHSSAELDAPLRLFGCRGTEAMNALFEVELLLGRVEPLRDAEVEGLLDAPCAVVFDRGPGQLMCGVLAEISRVDTDGSESRYLARLVPRLQLLTHSRASRVLTDIAIPDVVDGLLDLYDVPATLHLLFAYDKRPLVVQYDESDFRFLSRWLEHYGICYWFSHDPTGDHLHLGDAASVCVSARAHLQLPHAERSSLQLSEAVVSGLSRVWRRGPARVVLHDYGETQPTAPPLFHGLVPSTLAFGTVHRYAGPLASETEGVELAKRRVERMRSELCFFRGATNASEVRSGHLLDVVDEQGDAQRLLVTRTTFAVGLPVDADAKRGAAHHRPASYVAEFEAIEAGQEARPAAVTPWPRIHGVVLAYVCGDGELAEPDADGRYVVHLPFASPDPTIGSPSAAATTSAVALGANDVSVPLRVAQLSAGSAEGSHFPLRNGAPVLLSFHDGDPDRPFIVAAVAQGETSHVGRADNATQTVIATASGVRLELDDRNSAS